MTNKQITISKKSVGGPSCAKCGELSTEKSAVKCLKGHRHYDAGKCDDYDDRSRDTRAASGGTTGVFYER